MPMRCVLHGCGCSQVTGRGVDRFIMQNVVIIKSDAIIAVVEMGSAMTPMADRQPQCRVLILDCRSRVRLKVNFKKEKKKVMQAWGLQLYLRKVTCKQRVPGVPIGAHWYCWSSMTVCFLEINWTCAASNKPCFPSDLTLHHLLCLPPHPYFSFSNDLIQSEQLGENCAVILVFRFRESADNTALDQDCSGAHKHDIQM